MAEHLFRGGRRCYLVSENGHVRRLITPHEVKQVQRAQWPEISVGEIMRPLRHAGASLPFMIRARAIRL